jgi:retron-type reverse transcriptase
MYNHIISVENLCDAWQEFIRGKKSKKDVADFSLNLSQNIFQLHEELRTKSYRHGAYEAFSISDPKPRSIHKATVRDRLLHHAIYRVLYSHFDRKFIYDSYSCRHGKGTHKALDRFRHFVRKVSESNSRTCWVLKCDVRKFFASIDQTVLIDIVRRHISDPDVIWLLERVVESFASTGPGKGLPLGNLTSQLLVNVYMNEFDQFVKHQLKQKYYIRYADDFVIMDHDKVALMEVLPKVQSFLLDRLKLTLHPDKIVVQTATSGVDFLGWVHFYHHRVLRTTTKKRMFRNIQEKEAKAETVQSYLGLIGHGNSWKLRQEIEDSVCAEFAHTAIDGSAF